MKWQKVRKRPITVEARPFDGNPDDPDVMATSIMNGGQVVHGFVVVTHSGPAQINPGDWIIKSTRGEKYPITHPDLLETYDFVDED